MQAEPTYAQLRGLLRQKFEGTEGAFQKSIDVLVKEMRINIDELAENPPRYNGGKVKSEEQKLECIQLTIKPILEAGKDLINGTLKGHQGWTSKLELEQQDWKDFGGSTIDIMGAERKLVEAINDWLDFAHEQPDFGSKVKLPLPPRHEARTKKFIGIDHLREIYSDTMDEEHRYTYWTPATNDEYAKIFADYQKLVSSSAPAPGQE